MADAAIRYAEALLMAVKRENALAAVTDELRLLAREFSPRAKVFAAPVFPVREQMATVNFVMADAFHPLTKRFMCLLASSRRLGEIGRIADAYDKMARKELGKTDLYLTVYEESAPDNTEYLVESSKAKGLFKVDRKNVEIHLAVDKSLLGGFVAECEGLSWDCSLRARMLEMSKVIWTM
jgi:F0F1-type ATP synthase delta subunit